MKIDNHQGCHDDRDDAPLVVVGQGRHSRDASEEGAGALCWLVACFLLVLACVAIAVIDRWVA